MRRLASASHPIVDDGLETPPRGGSRVLAMKSLVLVVALAVGTLTTAATPVSGAQDECLDAPAWPSFAKVARTARSIYMVTVTDSVDDIAVKARSTDVMRGAAPGQVDLRRLKPRRTNNGCPGPSGPYARVGQKLLIAYDGLARDGESSIDAVALVGRVRGRTVPGSSG